MIRIALDPIPNQSFSIRLDDHFYNITLKSLAGIMGVTIVRDNVTLQDNMRAVAGTLLLPYRYQESGNFFILTNDGDLPNYTQFGITQFLIYMSQAEVEAGRAGT